MKHKKNSKQSNINHSAKHTSKVIRDEVSSTASKTVNDEVVSIDVEEVKTISMEDSANKNKFDDLEVENDNKASSESVGDESSAYKIEIPGYEMVREKAPKVAEVADAIYDQWKKDGDFQGLPLPIPPLAQVAVGLGLRKAKDFEKKLDEKGVFTAAKMGVEFAKMKVEQSQNPLIKKFLKK